jgi:hypothetical protein
MVIAYPALVTLMKTYYESIVPIVVVLLAQLFLLSLFDCRLKWNITIYVPNFSFMSSKTARLIVFPSRQSGSEARTGQFGRPNITSKRFDVRPFILWFVIPMIMALISAMLACEPTNYSRGIALGADPDDWMHRFTCVLHNVSLIADALCSLVMTLLFGKNSREGSLLETLYFYVNIH